MATTAVYAVPSSGMMILLGAIVAVVSYFLGCFNGAVIVSKYILRDDVRNHGSGNAGLARDCPESSGTHRPRRSG